MFYDYTEDLFVEQPSLGLFAEISEKFGRLTPLKRLVVKSKDSRGMRHLFLLRLLSGRPSSREVRL